MATSFIVSGASVVADANVGTNSTGGFENGGYITVSGYSSPFESDDIIEVLVENTNADGEITGDSRIVGIVVYDSSADYLNGVTKYNYTPMNPGQYATIQSDVSGLGDTYLRFNANVLTPEEPGAPTFNQLLLAPQVDFTTATQPIQIDHIADIDYDADNTIDTGTTEDGNGFFNLENNSFAPVCFAAGTRIQTDRGLRQIEDLAAGDLLQTLDQGLVPVRWVGGASVPGTGRNAPVRIQPQVLGNTRALVVSQNHRILVTGPMAELLFGDHEVLVAAKHLVNDTTIRITPCNSITYYHLLLDEHQVIFAEGTPSESLYLGECALDSYVPAVQDELIALRPDVLSPAAVPLLARHELTAKEALTLRNRVGDTLNPGGRGGALPKAAHSPRHPQHREAS